MTATQPVFYYDLGDPDCYLAAERIIAELGVVPEWEPVLTASVTGHPIGEIDRERIAGSARAHGLQSLRWPAAWPPDSTTAMLAATYAKHVGRVVAFSLAAFRQAFAGGRDLGDESTVLIAAAACEMHPTAVLKGVQLKNVTGALQRAGERAIAAGVHELPAIELGEQLFTGPSCVQDASAILAAPR